MARGAKTLRMDFGQSTDVGERNMESAYMGEDTKDTIGRRGTSGLWTLGNP